jgi:hypothetical protein
MSSSTSSAASGYFSSPSFADDLDFLNYPSCDNSGIPSVGSSSSSSYGCPTTTWTPNSGISQQEDASGYQHQVSPHQHMTHQGSQHHSNLQQQQFHYNGDNNVNNYYHHQQQQQQQQYYCNSSSDQSQVYSSSHFQEHHHQTPSELSVNTVISDPVYPCQTSHQQQPQPYLNQCQSYSPFVAEMTEVQQQHHQGPEESSPRLLSHSNTSIPVVSVKSKSVKREKKSVKKRRDPNEPQKPVSAYALFFRDRQATIKVGRPNASFGEISKIVASMWDQLDQDSKSGYKRRTEQAKKEYLKALAAYRASLLSSISSCPPSTPNSSHHPQSGVNSNSNIINNGINNSMNNSGNMNNCSSNSSLNNNGIHTTIARKHPNFLLQNLLLSKT